MCLPVLQQLVHTQKESSHIIQYRNVRFFQYHALKRLFFSYSSCIKTVRAQSLLCAHTIDQWRENIAILKSVFPQLACINAYKIHKFCKDVHKRYFWAESKQTTDIVFTLCRVRSTPFTASLQYIYICFFSWEIRPISNIQMIVICSPFLFVSLFVSISSALCLALCYHKSY